MTDLSIERRLRDIETLLDRIRTRESMGASGTWTPVFAGTTIAGTFTYTTQSGRWQQYGKLIFIQFDIAISAISVAPTGNMTITGLPTASGASVGYGPISLGFVSNLDYPTSKAEITALVPPGGLSRINLYTSQDNSGGAAYPAANFTNANCELIGGGFYEID